MSDEVQYTVRWKGKEYGPFQAHTIRHKLSSGEFSLMHEIFVHEEWISLDRFFNGNEIDITESASYHPIDFSNAEKSKKETDEDDDYKVPTIQDFIVIIGYACCIASLFIFPRAFGMTAFMAGALNLVLRNYSHGIAQIFLSMACYYAGYHYLAFIK